MTNTLWQLDEAELDERNSYVNGRMSSPFTVPASSCSYCEYNSYHRIQLPIVCPMQIREEMEAVSEAETVVASRKLKKYMQRWLTHFQEQEAEKIVPGVHLQPMQWAVPTYPRADIFWGIRLNIVSEKFYQAFHDEKIGGIDFFPVTIERVGDREPTDPFPDEGWYTEVELRKVIPPMKNPKSVGTFYNAICKEEVTSKQDELYKPEVTFSCDVCGYAEYDEPQAGKIERFKTHNYWKKKRLFPRRFVQEEDVFRSHVFSGLILKPHAYELIKEYDLSTCVVRKLTVEDI